MSSVAFELKLEAFEGPLDLLLYLVNRHKLNIYDIEISLLLEQYLEYIDGLEKEDFDQAGDFLAMAARLVYIKTCSLLPRAEEAEELKKELEGELIEYSVCKEAAERLKALCVYGDVFVRPPEKLPVNKVFTGTMDVSLLVKAYLGMSAKSRSMKPVRAEQFKPIVSARIVTVTSKIVHVLKMLYTEGFCTVAELYEGVEDRSARVATFLAVLELTKSGRIMLNDENTEITLNRDIPKKRRPSAAAARAAVKADEEKPENQPVQVAVQVAEEKPEKQPMQIAVLVPEEKPENQPVQIAVQVAEEKPENQPVQIAVQVAEEKPEKQPMQIAVRVPEEKPENQPVQIAVQVAEEKPENQPAQIAVQVPEEKPENQPVQIAVRVAEEKPENQPAQIAVRVPEEKPERHYAPTVQIAAESRFSGVLRTAGEVIVLPEPPTRFEPEPPMIPPFVTEFAAPLPNRIYKYKINRFAVRYYWGYPAAGNCYKYRRERT